MSQNISEGRSIVYYLGILVGVVGVIVFFSCFLEPMQMTMGSVTDFSQPMGGLEDIFGGFLTRGILGIILIGAGSFLMHISRSKGAGSGVIPEGSRVRGDFELSSQTRGKMINDTLDQIEDVNAITREVSRPDLNEISMIKVSCQQCHSLNDESAKFCIECGNSL